MEGSRERSRIGGAVPWSRRHVGGLLLLCPADHRPDSPIHDYVTEAVLDMLDAAIFSLEVRGVAGWVEI